MNVQLVMENLAEKKKAIFESTLQLIKENGFHGSPISLVAKNACCAAGTIYHYFDSKDTLIMELNSYVKSRLLEVLTNESESELDFKEQFTNRWVRICNFYIENPDILYFIEQFANSPYKDRGDINEEDKFKETVIAFYNRAMEKGVIKEMNQELIRTLVHSSIVTTAKMVLSGKITVNEADLMQMAGIMWKGLLIEK